MPTLNLKPGHKVVQSYYNEINNLAQLSLFSEGAVAPAFAGLLRACAGQLHWTLAEQFSLKRGERTIRVDGALLDAFKLVHGVWEAKDTHDDLAKEVKKKLAAGYPKENILFQAPDRAIIWQNGQQLLDADISRPADLVEALQLFFAYQPPAFEQWEQAVGEFKDKVPQLAAGLLNLIEQERRTNRRFIQAFDDFTTLCREAINPNIAPQAVEEMLIQHLLTERIFRKVFNHPDFVERNIIAHEIEKVIQALTAHHFSRSDFLKSLDRFYGAIETTAATIDDFSQKQAFLNTVYEKFFQGFSVKLADTHGIVYTPQPIVDFMVRSVEDILQKEFGRSLAEPGVHILDPFVGTGNFILRVMREIPRSKLPDKYAHELHCNEVMLLPYYIASLNIEHDYYDLAGTYEPFEGICLVDTFELTESQQMPLFTRENTERVQRQQTAPIFVIIGNPPYNAWQLNENDNNKNRKYPIIDKRVAETYASASKATNKNSLSDVYVKAFRWASDRIKQNQEGIVAFVTNNSFIDQFAFDGMRKYLGQEFDTLYILDLGGNVRKNPKLSGTTHNVFGIQVGVSINLLVKKKGSDPPDSRNFVDPSQTKIYYARVDEFWRKEQKYDFLDEKQHWGNIDWQELKPNKNNTWLTKGLQSEFETFLPIGTKEAKAGIGKDVIFENFSNGVKTNRDAWAYNFNPDEVVRNIRRMIDTYNEQVLKWSGLSIKPHIDDFVLNDDIRISWSEGLKSCLRREITLEFKEINLRHSIYRPFTKNYLYFDKYITERRYQMPSIFPTPETEITNHTIWLKVGSEWPMFALMVNKIPDLLPQGGSQCFPFYTYDEDGSNRQENITDWALEQFRRQYGDDSITKWDIFHYVYALLHHPAYREKYAANLRRDLPHIPFAPDFWAFAQAGSRLAELHVHYEDQPAYPLKWLENPAAPLDWQVERMKLSKDKTQLHYNDFLTLAGIPPEVFTYRLGNRSALEWVIDQYQVSTDARSGIANDPNRPDDPQYIVRLIGQVITVSVETVKVVAGLPELEL